MFQSSPLQTEYFFHPPIQLSRAKNRVPVCSCCGTTFAPNRPPSCNGFRVHLHYPSSPSSHPSRFHKVKLLARSRQVLTDPSTQIRSPPYSLPSHFSPGLMPTLLPHRPGESTAREIDLPGQHPPPPPFFSSLAPERESLDGCTAFPPKPFVQRESSFLIQFEFDPTFLELTNHNPKTNNKTLALTVL